MSNTYSDDFWDRENGLGAVPNQTAHNVAYFGFEARMKASDFLLLSTDLPDKDLSYHKEQLDSGKKFGLPFLGIDWYGDEEDSIKANKWRVDKHEGRHRVELFIQEYGDIEITVSIFTSRYSSELRNRNLIEEMFYKGVKIYPQRCAKFEERTLDIADIAQPEFFNFEIGKSPKKDKKKSKKRSPSF